MIYILRSQAFADVHIVRAPDQDHMHKRHPDEERNDGKGHDLVFFEQLVVPHHASEQSNPDYGQREAGTPP